MNNLVIIFLFTILHVQYSYEINIDTELYSAITDLEPLKNTHQSVIDNLEEYLRDERERINTIEIYVERYIQATAIAINEGSSYVEDPLNSFMMIKRLTSDLDEIQNMIRKKTAYKKKPTGTLPSQKDLIGALEAVGSLQSFYDLNISDICDGILKTFDPKVNTHFIEYSTPLTPGDCFLFGAFYNIMEDYDEAEIWMEKAEQKYLKENNQEYRSITQMIPDPDNPFYPRNFNQEYPKHIQNLINKPQICKPLCNGEKKLQPVIVKRLKCKYFTDNHPFLKLAPLKMEQLYLNPDILIVYNAVSDSEIEHLKELAKPRLHRALLRSSKGEVQSRSTRVEKVGYIQTNDTEVTLRITRRITDITGLSMDHSEFQVGNYGIGGYFFPHHDYNHNKSVCGSNGDYIATALFYLSNVTYGGATVFLRLGLTVYPIKGAVLYWMNLHHSGEGDEATEHAGCPILRGDKWVMHTFYFQAGQEFLQPCNLQYQEHGILHQILPAVPRYK